MQHDDGAPREGTAARDRHRRGILSWRPAGTAGVPGAAGTMPLRLESSRDGLVHIPASASSGGPRPLLVMFHGAGGSAADVLPLVVDQAERHGVMVLAPDSRGTSWDIIHAGYGPDVTFLDRALDSAFGHRGVDAGRIAFAGFSDGASYALSLGLANAALVGDILAFSPGFFVPGAAEAKPRIFVSHGQHDRVLPIDRCGRRIEALLTHAGYEVDYREFAGGHGVPAAMVEAAFRRFLR